MSVVNLFTHVLSTTRKGVCRVVTQDYGDERADQTNNGFTPNAVNMTRNDILTPTDTNPHGTTRY
ncbi:hypothetical protein E2C01_075687 [Portunus trituberculatus]|uniref:Uncharacterized protein n=1 Tax=Portunus trituberculatus TaxID=210409 RepID=A0A5B7IHQ5_PORTR|nr:hypothetical protein [Portunus trituberculatus]